MHFLEYRDMFRAFGPHQIPMCWKCMNTAQNKYLRHYLHICSQVISMYFFYEFSYYTPNNIFGVKSYINYAVLYAKHHFWCQVIPMNFFYIFTYYTPNTIFGVKTYITYAVLYAKHHFWCQVISKYFSTYLLIHLFEVMLFVKYLHYLFLFLMSLLYQLWVMLLYQLCAMSLLERTWAFLDSF